jgi:hypothetical protein
MKLGNLCGITVLMTILVVCRSFKMGYVRLSVSSLSKISLGVPSATLASSSTFQHRSFALGAGGVERAPRSRHGGKSSRKRLPAAANRALTRENKQGTTAERGSKTRKAAVPGDVDAYAAHQDGGDDGAEGLCAGAGLAQYREDLKGFRKANSPRKLVTYMSALADTGTLTQGNTYISLLTRSYNIP